MRDIDVRRAVRVCLRDMHADEPETVFLEEMDLWSGSARIDLAVVNGEMAGFEIKSDRDTLERLPRQMEVYNRIFDRVSLIVGRKHLEKALDKIPDWWGVYCAIQVDGVTSIELSREPIKNPSIDPLVVADLLDKKEIISILDARGLARGWRSKSASAVQERLVAHLAIDELRDEVRAVFKRRAGVLRELVPDQLDMPID